MRILTIAFMVACAWAAALGAQEELFPEPGALGEVDRYHLKLRKVFSEAYTEGVAVRAVFLPSETVIFLNGTDQLILLRPKAITVWSHEHAELLREGKITVTDAKFDKIPPEEVLKDQSEVPMRVEDIPISRCSRKVSEKVATGLRAAWEDALLHANHQQEFSVGLDTGSSHYSMWIRGRGVVSGMSFTTDNGTIAHALESIAAALLRYAGEETGEEGVLRAIATYQETARKRSNKPTHPTAGKPPG